MAKQKITVEGLEITIDSINDEDYVSLTDIARKTDRPPSESIRDWLRNTQTLLFLEAWEAVHNPDSKLAHLHQFRIKAAENRYGVSPQSYVKETGAIGIVSKSGRYGGTYAHRDIALNFCYWLSPQFQVYFLKEFQRLKEEEAKLLGQSWNIQRLLTKANFHIQTASVRQSLPLMEWNTKRESMSQASEMDMLNRIVFGMTAREWKQANPERKGNIRDHATEMELVIISNLQSINGALIRKGLEKNMREHWLLRVATFEMQTLLGRKPLKEIKKLK